MNPIAELLRQLGPVRVAALAATGIAVLGFFIFLSSRLSSGGMALLYGDLDPQDSGQIIQTLQSKNIPYDIEEEVNKYLPYFDQEKKKKHLVQKLNNFYNNYWIGDSWTPRKCRPPRVKTYASYSMFHT